MFAKYLHLSLKIIDIGRYERIAESAEQYAERLLSVHASDLSSSSPRKVAHTLVHEYKDHGFVIDKKEAVKIFGGKIIKENTPEYEIGNTVYKVLSEIEGIVEACDHSFFLIGSLLSLPEIRKKQIENP